MMKNFTLGLMTICMMATVAIAQDAADDAKKPARTPPTEPRPAAQNLDNPSGVAIHPESGHIFVATKKGVIRLFREGEKRRLQRKTEIARFPTDVYGKGPKYDIGPLGVAFIGTKQLVVGDGSRPDGEELVRVFDIADAAPEKPQPEKKAAHTLGPITAGAESAKGEGNFYGVAVTDKAIFVTCNGDDTKGWIAKADLTDGKPGKLTPFIATKEAVEVDAPCAITISPDGDLVVGQMGEITVPGDSLVCIYDAETGKLKKKYETGLNDITGLAYSPDGRLFAVDFSWIDTKKGALHELKIEGDTCTATKKFDLDKPTAIAFDDKGNALITTFGTAEEGAKGTPGKLMRVVKRLLK